MITKKIFVCLFTLCLISSCQQKKSNPIEGIWVVDKVQVGENSMTPIARWTQFHADGTQMSGNGWLRHLFGTWSIDGNQLSVSNTNATKDPNGPFEISIEGNSMVWKRNEDGQEVVVTLSRATDIPTSDGNRLIGLWKLTKATDDGNDITAIMDPNDKASIYFSWDNVYRQMNMPNGRSSGIYKIHGHKPEIQLVNYGAESKFSFWSFSLEGNKLTLTSTDQKSQMEFESIDEFIN